MAGGSVRKGVFCTSGLGRRVRPSPSSGAAAIAPRRVCVVVVLTYRLRSVTAIRDGVAVVYGQVRAFVARVSQDG